MAEPNDRSGRFRAAITAFIETRKEAKLKGKEDDFDSALKYVYETWLSDAARRVSQIQAVTHVLKATHPDARGSSLHAPPDTLPQHDEIGTHSLGADYVDDVVGNAAALDVYKFLKIEVEGRRLLDWMIARDADLKSALHPDADIASAWIDAFAALIRADGVSCSHATAKQVYWLTGDNALEDGAYQLLQPMFSSSLAHSVHVRIQDARFGEPNTEARKAYRAKEAHDLPYLDYRALVARKLGGTKPQNISQLNSERGGVNYLLASLPPKWARESPQRLLRLKTTPDRFTYFEDVRQRVAELASFLLTDPDKTMETRLRREAMERSLGELMSAFAASMEASHEPGWTRAPDCTLPLCEQIWLDPERSELPVREHPDHPEWTQQDMDFNAACERGDWPDEVAGIFANWLNGKLREAGLNTVGDTESRHWARQAIVEAHWPVPVQRRTPQGASA